MSIETRRRRRIALAGLLAAAFSVVVPGCARAAVVRRTLRWPWPMIGSPEVKRLLARGSGSGCR